MESPIDEAIQRAEWRTRLIRAVLDRKHDDETLYAMLDAGLEQAESEGMLDGAMVCQRIADEVPHARRVASVLAQSIRDLDRKNRERTPVARACGQETRPEK